MIKAIICKECGIETRNGNSFHKLCTICNKKRLDKKKEKKKPTGERKMFLEIWSKREHVCFNCGKFLGNEPKASFFAHILPKSTHPHLRLVSSNINLLCVDCHVAYDHRGVDAYNKRKNYDI